MVRTKTIARNTAYLYMRMMIVMAVNLFTVRIVLKALGTVDYGIYNVVAGVITMLSCVTSVLMTATQRFYSFSIGEDDLIKLNKIFSISIEICFLGTILIILISETIGLYFVNNLLNIPSERDFATNWLYQTTVISFIITFLQIPFGAAIIAHEKMGTFAAISTIETILKLGAALILLDIHYDKLIIYGISLALISASSLFLYIVFSVKRFPECHYHHVQDSTFFKELLSFSGWNFMGSVAGVGMHYVNTIIVNVFFGPIINASQAIAFQISSALNSFSGSFIMALRPPMIKLYAEKKYEELNIFFDISNKVIYYCMLVLCVPLFWEIQTILSIWLNISDEQTILFSKLIIIYTIILVMNNPISIIMQASGYVKQYFVPVESITLLCPLVTFMLFKIGLPSHYVFIAMIVCVIISHIIRLYILNKYYPWSLINAYIAFVLRAFIISIGVFTLTYFIRTIIANDYIRLISVTFFSIATTILLAYFFALNKRERSYIINKFKILKSK